MSQSAYRSASWYDAAKIEGKNLGGNKKIENAEHKNNFEVEKVGRKSSEIWNYKYSESIHVDPDDTNSNQPIPDDLTNIRSIHESVDIHAI